MKNLSIFRLSPWQRPSIHPCLVSFLFIPSLYSLVLNRKIFHLLVYNVPPQLVCYTHVFPCTLIIIMSGFVYTTTLISVAARFSIMQSVQSVISILRWENHGIGRHALMTL